LTIEGFIRLGLRKEWELRPISIIPDVQKNPGASLIWRQGNTHVLVGVNISDGVPPWLYPADKVITQGWLTAEYQMLPGATSPRMIRERKSLSGRTQEIQRLIGRSLRGILDLTKIKGKTILVDCDVIQADGGTRTASVCGGYIALSIAIDKWLNNKVIEENPIKEALAAISLGKLKGGILLDLDYVEDSSAEVDFNLVMTESGGIIELQATAEGDLMLEEDLRIALEIGKEGINKIIGIYKAFKEERKYAIII